MGGRRLVKPFRRGGELLSWALVPPRLISVAKRAVSLGYLASSLMAGASKASRTPRPPESAASIMAAQ